MELVTDTNALSNYSKDLSLKCAIDLLNTILSESKESEMLWRIISSQA